MQKTTGIDLGSCGHKLFGLYTIFQPSIRKRYYRSVEAPCFYGRQVHLFINGRSSLPPGFPQVLIFLGGWHSAFLLFDPPAYLRKDLFQLFSKQHLISIGPKIAEISFLPSPAVRFDTGYTIHLVPQNHFLKCRIYTQQEAAI
jgi:hypothetical protein